MDPSPTTTDSPPSRARILIDLRCLETPSAARGVGRYTIELIKAIRPLLPDGWQLLGLSWSGVGTRLGIGDIRYPGPRRGISLADELILPRLTRRAGIDLYHSPVYPLFRPTPGGPRRVITVHDLTADLFPDAFTWRQRRVFRKMFKSAVMADRVITVSETTRRDLLRRYPVPGGRVAPIPNGIADCFLEGPGASGPARFPQPYLLYVGGLDPTKNVPFLLDVLAELHRTGTLLHLVLVAGDPTSCSDLALRAAELGFDRHLVLAGRLDDDELADAYRGATAFLFPSRYEGFGLPPLEAMACGCPVVSSPEGSLEEVLGDAAILLQLDDASIWAQSTRSLLADPDRRTDMVRRGVARAAGFTWSRTARQTLQAYRMVLGR